MGSGLLHNRAMSRMLACRLFLAFALMLGSLLSGQMALAAAVVELSSSVMGTSPCHEDNMNEKAVTEAERGAQQSASCCAGQGCQCVCVVPAVLQPVIVSVLAWPAMAVPLSISHYISVEPLHLLRPPIA
jgi:hypothetical protein